MADDSSSTKRSPVVYDPFLSNSAFDIIRDPSLVRNGPQSLVDALFGTVERIRSELERLGVLADLGPQPQRELAALVLDLDGRYEAWWRAESYFRQLKVRSRRGAGHVRKLARTLAGIRDRLERLARDAQKVDASFASHVLPHVNQALAALTRVTLIPPRETVHQYTDRIPGWYDQVRRQHFQPTDPRRYAATQLVQYFRDASLSSAEAEVRTGSIGNARWKWGYTIAPNDLGDPDCAAVRMLIARKKAKDRSAKPSRSV